MDSLRPNPRRASSRRSTVSDSSGSQQLVAKFRKATLVLNAARRFRYFNISDEQQLARKKLRKSFLAVRAVQRLSSGEGAVCREPKNWDADALARLVQEGSISDLQQAGGAEGLARVLRTNLKSGISADEVADRQRLYGSNRYTEKPPPSFLSFVKEALQDVTLIVLIFCAILSLGVGIWTEGIKEGWYDGAGISLSVVIVVLVTAVSDYRQALQFQQLNNEKKKIFIDAVRDNRRQKVSVYELVVGDVVILSVGDIIPTDGVYIAGHSLTIDESSMTGESETISKSEEIPVLLAGTKVQEGIARMLVTGVGMNTEWGNLMASLGDAEEDPTPLQLKLTSVATFVGKLGLLVAVLVFTILMSRFFLYEVDLSHWTADDTLKVVRYLAISTTIIVVAVPEGLPLAVTLTLAYAMKRMMVDKALVRHLVACETMGSATTICSDKTGTLTSNRMTVVRAWTAGCVVHEPARVKERLTQEFQKVLLESIFVNTSGDVASGRGSTAPSLSGSPTEKAVLSLGIDLGGDFEQTRSQVQILQVEPFSSKSKRMGTAVAIKERPGCVRVHWKGAAEVLLDRCSHVVAEGGKVVPLDGHQRSELAGVIDGMATDSLRTLCIAYADVPVDVDAPLQLLQSSAGGGGAIPSEDLTCLAVVGLQDPLRPEVTDAVELCKSAGICVRMVTGDNLSTAKAIARQCGILTDGVAIEGPVFRAMTHEELQPLLPRLQVMARSSPSDKLRLVRELRTMGEVVAVTGDGTNDAPALKEADIGLAMGIAGTEVAKESADVVILDDNFASVVNVARWGRSVFENIQKFVQFQLTVNLVALTLNFLSAIVTGEAPLTAVQLLWVNLIMDTLGALALATEPPGDQLMLKPPVGRDGRLISAVMWRNIISQALFQLTALGLLQFHGRSLLEGGGLLAMGDESPEVLNTIIFNTFVFCQVFNEINSRDMEKVNVLKDLHKNSLFVFIIAMTVLFQIILVYFLGHFASTVPLTAAQFFFCVGVGALSMPYAAVIKMIDVSDGDYSRPISEWASWDAVEDGRDGNDDYLQLPADPDVEQGRRRS